MDQCAIRPVLLHVVGMGGVPRFGAFMLHVVEKGSSSAWFREREKC